MAIPVRIAGFQLMGLCGVLVVSGCTVIVGGVLKGKDADGGGPITCTSAPQCDDRNMCTDDTCSPDGHCVSIPAPEGRPCEAGATCSDGVCRPCAGGGCVDPCSMVACTGGQTCIFGECRDICMPPCGPMQVCMGDVCMVPPPGCGNGILELGLGEQCDPPDGIQCLPSCQLRCTIASDCPDDGNVCTTETCDLEACTYPPADLDGDTFPPTECGGSDCNDADPGAHPSGAEVCNGADDNCDGVIDEGITATLFPDLDTDGYGDSGSTPMSIAGCAGVAGYIGNNRDCYDGDPRAHPYDDPGTPAPFFDVPRLDGSFDYDCDGFEVKQFGLPSCTAGPVGTCGGGSETCTGTEGIIPSATVCGMMYLLRSCPGCTATGACAPVNSGMITLKCH